MFSLDHIFRRLTSYSLWEVLLEMAVIGACVYVALRFLRGTRGAGIVRGLIFLLIVVTLVIRVIGESIGAFERLGLIYDRFLGLVAIMLLVVFQPELRRAMIRLGETRLFRPSRKAMLPVVEAVSTAAEFLSKSQFGALIAIERQVGLSGLTESGIPLDATVSDQLLRSIFWPNNPLHDLGVVIRGNRIVAAGVQFPLAEEGAVSVELGSRHRAGVGLSTETDSIIVIVSEETGRISIAEHGRLELVPRESVREALLERLGAPPAPAADAAGEPGSDEDAAEPAPAAETEAVSPRA